MLVCAHLCLCVYVFESVWRCVHLVCPARCLSAGVDTKNRSGYLENKVTAWDLTDKLKETVQRRGRLKQPQPKQNETEEEVASEE